MSQLFSVMSKPGLDLIKGTPEESMAAISIAFTSLTPAPPPISHWVAAIESDGLYSQLQGWAPPK